MLEAALKEWRGGNSMHVRNLRCMHDAPQDVLVEAYPEEKFWQDLAHNMECLMGSQAPCVCRMWRSSIA